MEKIELSNKQRLIFQQIAKKQYQYEQPDENDLSYLEENDLIKITRTKDVTDPLIRISTNGRAYFAYNSKLKNPSPWDDKKFKISTTLSIIAIMISLVALIVSISVAINS